MKVIGYKKAGPISAPDALIAFEADTPTFEPYEDDKTDKLPDLAEADDMDHEAYDKYISARILLPKGDTMEEGVV